MGRRWIGPAFLSTAVGLLFVPPLRLQNVLGCTATGIGPLPNLDGDVADAAREAFSTATRTAALAGAALLCLGLLATVSLRNRREVNHHGHI